MEDTLYNTGVEGHYFPLGHVFTVAFCIHFSMAYILYCHVPDYDILQTGGIKWLAASNMRIISYSVSVIHYLMLFITEHLGYVNEYLLMYTLSNWNIYILRWFAALHYPYILKVNKLWNNKYCIPSLVRITTLYIYIYTRTIKLTSFYLWNIYIVEYFRFVRKANLFMIQRHLLFQM